MKWTEKKDCKQVPICPNCKKTGKGIQPGYIESVRNKCKDTIGGKTMLRETVTKYGAVRGVASSDPRVTVYKGIPFAAPPTGENRWRAPQPCKPWEGTLDAVRFGPISVQDQPAVGTDIYCREWHVDPEIPMDEDCLYLNIWTPARTRNEKLPVLVWYFGGGFQWGYPAEMEFDGERLARRGIIVVSVNYRLNVFGFLAHPEITGEAPGAPANFGHLDQQAGLIWTYENIEAFGGDPENITIAGQSAGGGSVLSQLACAKNRPYIRRAVIMSAMIRSPYETGRPFGNPISLSEAEENGKAFFKVLGAGNLEEARKADARTVLKKYNEYIADHPRMMTVRDDAFCTGDPLAMLAENRALDVPVMSGSTADEFPAVIRVQDRKELEEQANIIFGSDAEVFLSFPEAAKKSEQGYAKVNGIELTCAAVFESRAAHGSTSKNWYYRFGPEIPGWDQPGAFHSSDLWFFFETIGKCWRPFGGKQFELARQMCDYFAGFVKNGDPNGNDMNGRPNPQWQPYTADEGNAMLFLQQGAVPSRLARGGFTDFLKEVSRKKLGGDWKDIQAYNPYLPNWEYIPDGEPYVFGDRVYIYGSHDFYDGDVFCLGDYVCWSAPVTDLGSWRYEGVIYRRDADPLNRDSDGCLYAPDVTVGPDGRYYLYYVLSNQSRVSVAVCDTPAGEYSFYGYVHDRNGGILGEREGDEPQFDPGVLTEGNKTYLYTGFCGHGDKSRHGAMGITLGADMLTMETEPVFIIPGHEYGAGTGFDNHEYFEAASIRKMNGKYIFIYSSCVMHELCWAVSENPLSGFRYGGVLVSNCDIGITKGKKAEQCMGYGANNHGSMVQIGEDWYIFYHRHTNGTWYSRQGCAEKLTVNADGTIEQAEMTSCGLNKGPLHGKGIYPAHIVCNMFTQETLNKMQLTAPHLSMVRQSGADGQKVPGYVGHWRDGTTIGYKYFDIHGLERIRFSVHGYTHGTIEIRTKWDGEIVGSVKTRSANRWTDFTAEVNIPDGVHALYFTFHGSGDMSLREFELI